MTVGSVLNGTRARICHKLDRLKLDRAKRKPHQYSLGDLVTVDKPEIVPKLSFPWHDPYDMTVLLVCDNCTIKIQKEPSFVSLTR